MAAGKKDDKADKAEPQTDDAAAEAKKKKKKLFLFIGLAILLVAVSVGATFFVVSKMMASKNANSEEGEASESAASEVTATPAIYLALKPNFTVNYDVNGRQRFLQAELTLMYRDATLEKTLELHMPAIRNGLVLLLSSQVFEELQTADGKEKLRAAALKTVQDIITKEASALAEKSKEKEDDKKEKGKEQAKKPEPNIEQVLFTQFVMQ
jgi:flagellar FliL protein